MAKGKYTGVYTVEGKKGLSYGIAYTHPQTGERIRKILRNVTSEAQAKDIRSIELVDAKRGVVDQDYQLKRKYKTISFEAMIDEYLKWSKENKDSWDTDQHRAKPLRRAFRRKFMAEITPFMVDKYKIARSKEKSQTKEPISKATVNKELILGSQIYRKAIEWKKYHGENPFLKAGRFVLKKPKKPGSLTPEQVQSIMDNITHPVKRDMVAFDFNTGWRVSEIRKLKWEDVDLEHGKAWIVDPKNKNTLEVELNESALDIIKRQKRNGEHVFCHLNGIPFKTNLNNVIGNAASRAGIELPPRKAWHIFRRTWASMMLQNGCDLETLRVLGNWKDYSMPMWYADSGNSDHKRKVLNKLPKLDEKSGNGRNLTEMPNVVRLNA